jgi:MFS family permease
MQIVAQSLLILQITHGSALALGIVALAQSSSFFLFALVGGSVADRVDKRRFLLITQSLSMGLAFLLGILTLVGVIQVWMIVLIAFCSGTVLSFDQPTRSSLIPMLVPRKDLMNAISLQSTVFNGAAVLGPALAGITIGLLASLGHMIGLTGSLIGYAGNFLLNGISFFGVLFVLYFIRVPQEAIEQSTEKRGPMLDAIRAALRVVGRDPALPWVLSGYGALLFFGPSNTVTKIYCFGRYLELSSAIRTSVT